MELGEDNIRVKRYLPWVCWWNPRMDQVIQKKRKQRADEATIRSGYETQVSMRRFMDAADVAGAVVYMARQRVDTSRDKFCRLMELLSLCEVPEQSSFC